MGTVAAVMRSALWPMGGVSLLLALAAPAARSQQLPPGRATTATGTSAAAAAEPAVVCRNGLFADAQDGLALMRVRRGATVVQPDGYGYPDTTRRGRRATLPRGATVLVSGSLGAWTCVWWDRDGRMAEVVGWVRSEAIETMPVSAAAAPFLGVWAPRGGRSTDRVTITRIPGDTARLRVTGEATWSNGYATHVGEFDGPASVVPTGRANVHRLRYAEGPSADDCAATLTQLGPYLVISDNRKCGGVNVTFGGVWRRVGTEQRSPTR